MSSDASAELWARLLDYKSMMMISLQDTALHLQRRRPWLRAFTPTAVKGLEELVEVRVRQLVEELEKQRGTVDLDLWFKCFSCVCSHLYICVHTDFVLCKV